MSVGMARSTYLKKIAVKPEHITPTLTMAITLDHIFSITVALTGGIIWAKWGYQKVFLLGAGIAVVNLIFRRVIGKGTLNGVSALFYVARSSLLL